MKRGAKSAAAALCLFCLCFFAFPRIAGSYCYVSLIYKINEDKLERAVASLRAGCAATLPALRGVRGVSFESADGTVGFACFSFGIAPAGFYTGFYHSPDGAPKAFQNAKIELRPDGESWRYDEPIELRPDGESWRYDEPGGDNRYVTRRIKGNWYYYRMSF